jgi:hypothetical protein
MGFGTIWRLGQESEARLLWEHRFPARRLTIDVKFITSLELQILRCQLHGLSAFDPKVKVYDSAFPKVTDPEWEEWYQNLEEEYNRGIHLVLPDFLSELRRVRSDEIQSLGATWGVATEGWWHKQWPDRAAWALGEFIRVAMAAESQGMGVLAQHFG